MLTLCHSESQAFTRTAIWWPYCYGVRTAGLGSRYLRNGTIPGRSVPCLSSERRPISLGTRRQTYPSRPSRVHAKSSNVPGFSFLSNRRTY